MVNIATGSSLRFMIDVTNYQLTCSFGTSGGKQTYSPTLSLDTWYEVDFRVDVSDNPTICDWQVEGSAQTPVSYGQAATTISSRQPGTNVAITATFYVDDACDSVTSGDYPLGSLAVEALSPSSDGTHENSLMRLQDQASNVIGDVPAYDKVNSIPIGNISTYVKQTGIGTTYYAEVNFADTSNTTIQGATAVLAYRSSGTTANEGGCIVIDEDATQTTVWGNASSRADYSESSVFYKFVALPTPAGGWDKDAVNALKSRFGYSNNVATLPYWVDMIILVAYTLETASASVSPSASPSASPSVSPSVSASASPSASASISPSASPSLSASASASPSASKSASPSASASVSPSASPSISASASASPSASKSASKSASPSLSASASPSISESASASPSASPSVSVSASPSASKSVSASASPSASPSAPLNVVVNIDFETGDTSQFDWTYTGSGQMTVNETAALAGTGYGMDLDISASALLGGAKDFTRITQNKYRVRFFFDPNGAIPGNSNLLTILNIHDYDSFAGVSIGLQYIASTYYIKLQYVAKDDLGYLQGQNVAITDAPHCIEFLVEYATSSIAQDGKATLFVDGEQVDQVTGVDLYDLAKPDQIDWFGYQANSGTGHFYFDELIVSDGGSDIGCTIGVYPSASPSASKSASPSLSASASASPSASKSASASISPSASPSISASASASPSASPSISASASASPSASKSASPSLSASASASPSASKSASASISPSASPSLSASASASPSASKSASASVSPSASPSLSASASASPSASASASPSVSASASPSISASVSPSASPSLSASASASPSASKSASASISPSASASASPSLVAGSVCWGHSTGVIENNTLTFASNWSGTGSTSGSGDAEIMCLDGGEFMQSNVIITGTTLVTLLQNTYLAGDAVTLKYRHGNSEANCLAASWNNYTTPFTSLGYVQLRVEN